MRTQTTKARLCFGVVSSLGFALAACREPPASAPGNDHLPASYVENAGLVSPQAILYDPVADVYLVSNTPATTQPGQDGFITRITPRGKVQSLKWIAGGDHGVELRQPRGMALRGDTLYVADGGCVRLFRRSSGRPDGSVCLEGAELLSGMTVADSLVYVTDAGDPGRSGPSGYGIAAIAPGGRVSAVIDNVALFRPVGIAAGPWGLFVTTTGFNHVSQLTSGQPRPVLTGPSRDLGGIVSTRDGCFAFSNATDSIVHYVEVTLGKGRGAVWALARHLADPGQLGYDSRRDRVLIPETGRNRLVFVSLSD